MPTVLTFNDNGLLTPAKGISTTPDELYHEFVKPFPMSGTREDLYDKWTEYNRMLRQEIGAGFTQWVNGSFVTKELNPRDIDVLSFIPSHLYDQHKDVLDYFWADNWKKEKLDCYIVKVYPINHPSYVLNTLKYQNEWLKRYTKTKPDEYFRQFDKGFLIVRVI